jgi:hypothetical protein
MLAGLLALTSKITVLMTSAMIGVMTTAVMIGAMTTVTAAMTIMIGISRMILGGR